MKILFVDNSAETFLSHRLPLVTAIMETGAKVEVALPRGDSNIEKVLGRGIYVNKYHLKRRGINPIFELISIIELTYLFKNIRPDIIHLRTPKVWAYGGIAARIAKAKSVISHITGMGFAESGEGMLRNLAGSALKLLAKNSFRHPHQLIIVQNKDDQISLPVNLKCSYKKIRFIPGSGVNLNEWEIQPIPLGVPIVLLPARLLKEKGINDFVDAARILHKQNISVRCVLVGDIDIGNPSSVTLKQIEAWVGEKVIEWWGHRSDMVNVITQSTVICLPSYYREGLPKSILEGMATGRPIIAANSPGTREPIIEGVNGTLVSPKNPIQLASAIKKLICNRDICIQWGLAGRKMVEEKYSTAKVIRQTLDVFTELIAKSNLDRI